MLDYAVDLVFYDLGKLVNDEEKISLVKNVATSAIAPTYLMSEIIDIVKDNSKYKDIVSDNNKVALVNLLYSYFNTCYDKVIKTKGLEGLIRFAKIENYKVETIKGLRFATQNEITQGVRGLITELTYPLPEQEEKYKRLCLLAWTATGSPYMFKEAGYKLNYENGKVSTNIYEMIVMAKNDLVKLLEWMKVKKHFDDDMKLLRQIKRNGGGHKYATYSDDEITEEISIKQLIYFISKEFNKGAKDTNKDYRMALHYAIKGRNNLQYLTPSEISFMRVQYQNYLDSTRDTKVEMEVNIELKNKCEKLIEARKLKLIDSEHFVFNIVSTMQRQDYKKCSEKQMAIIDSALKEIDKKKPVVTEVNYTGKDEEINDNIQSFNDLMSDSELFIDEDCMIDIIETPDIF